MDFPVCATRVECSITKDRLQLYIRPHRLDAGTGHDGNRPFAPHSLIGLYRCRQVCLDLQTSVWPVIAFAPRAVVRLNSLLRYAATTTTFGVKRCTSKYSPFASNAQMMRACLLAIATSVL